MNNHTLATFAQLFDMALANVHRDDLAVIQNDLEDYGSQVGDQALLAEAKRLVAEHLSMGEA